MENQYKTDFKPSLQKLLRNIRLACGLSQREVADALMVNRSTYSYYESGKTSPDVQTLRILAKLYGVPATVFMFPERFANIDANHLKRGRRSRKPLPNPHRFGELTMEEKKVIEALRLQKDGETHG